MQITEQDYQNKLSTQKGIIEYLILVLNLEQQLIDLEKLDLELIDKEFGELFKEESCSFSLTDRIMTIIENASIQNSINSVTNDQFNKSELNFEIEKYKNMWKQLKIVEKNYNFNKRENVKQLINQVDMVVELLKNSQDQKLEILKILIRELLEEVKNNKIEFQKKIQNDQQYRQNENDEITDNNLTQIKGDQEHVKDLQTIIIILELSSSKIKKEKQLFCQILEETKQFSDKLHPIQKYSENIQTKTYEKFDSHFQNQIQIFEQLQWTTGNLQKNEKQSFKDYLKRIEIDIQLVKNEKEKLKNQIMGKSMKKTDSVSFQLGNDRETYYPEVRSQTFEIKGMIHQDNIHSSSLNLLSWNTRSMSREKLQFIRQADIALLQEACWPLDKDNWIYQNKYQVFTKKRVGNPLATLVIKKLICERREDLETLNSQVIQVYLSKLSLFLINIHLTSSSKKELKLITQKFENLSVIIGIDYNSTIKNYQIFSYYNIFSDTVTRIGNKNNGSLKKFRCFTRILTTFDQNA